MLLVLAWLLVSGWFVFVVCASDGFLPGALLVWSPPALATGGLTLAWLSARRRPVARRALAAIGGAWALVLASVVPLWADVAAPADYEWLVYEWAAVYAAFPAVLTLAALLRIASALGDAPGPQPES